MSEGEKREVSVRRLGRIPHLESAAFELGSYCLGHLGIYCPGRVDWHYNPLSLNVKDQRRDSV